MLTVEELYALREQQNMLASHCLKDNATSLLYLCIQPIPNDLKPLAICFIIFIDPRFEAKFTKGPRLTANTLRRLPISPLIL